MEKKIEDKEMMSNVFGLTDSKNIYIDIPKFNESFSNDSKWIKIGIDGSNDLPQQLDILYANADPLHKNLIDKQVNLICGLGFNPLDELKPFLNNEYSKKDLHEIVKLCARDLVIHGVYFLNIIWSQESKNQIARIEHIPAQKVRPEVPPDYNFNGSPNIEEEVLGWYVSKDWLRLRKAENEPKLYPAFDPKIVRDGEGNMWESNQILGIINKSNGMDYWGLPNYAPIINWLKISHSISVYQLNNLRNNLTPGAVIYYNDNGNFTPEQKQKHSKQIKVSFQGASNAFEPMIFYYKGTDAKPEIQFITQPNNDERFQKLIEVIQKLIMESHGATGMIAGIPQGGKMTKDEVMDEYQIYQTTVIQFYQKELENTFNYLKDFNGYTEELKLIPFMIFPEVPPTEIPSGSTINYITQYTKNNI